MIDKEEYYCKRVRQNVEVKRGEKGFDIRCNKYNSDLERGGSDTHPCVKGLIGYKRCLLEEGLKD